VRFHSLVVVGFACVPLVQPGLSAAQLRQARPPGIEQQSDSRDSHRDKLEREMLKRANQERQEQLRRDSEKLLKMANELKEYVDKTDQNILSLNVLKKAEEIEKLAHSVKEKMKTSY
jgi:hypothetical protein